MEKNDAKIEVEDVEAAEEEEPEEEELEDEDEAEAEDDEIKPDAEAQLEKVEEKIEKTEENIEKAEDKGDTAWQKEQEKLLRKLLKQQSEILTLLRKPQPTASPEELEMQKLEAAKQNRDESRKPPASKRRKTVQFGRTSEL